MVLAAKRRCRNAVDRRSRRRNFDRRCEVNFIPLVVVTAVDEDLDDEDRPRRRRHGRRASSPEVAGRQLLTCRDDVAGFSSTCPPSPRGSQSATASPPPPCNPVRENARRCETTHAALRGAAGRCRLFEICDRAVVVSGGWNDWTRRRWHSDNARGVYAMLRRHGFTAGNVKVFHADGLSDIATCERLHCTLVTNGRSLPAASWLRGPAVEHRSLAGVLSLSCVRLVADG